MNVSVVQVDHEYHVLVSDNRQFFAYRDGFEFADELDDPPSALAPKNAPSDVSVTGLAVC